MGYVDDEDGETDTDVSMTSHETSHAPGSSFAESPGDAPRYDYRRPQGQGRQRRGRSAVAGCRLASLSSDDDAGAPRARSCGYSSAECSSGGERGTAGITQRRMAEMEQRRNTISESLVRGSRASASSASDSEGTAAAGGRHVGTVSKAGQEFRAGVGAMPPPPQPLPPPAEGVEFSAQAKVQFAGVADDVPPDEFMAITKREPRPFSAAYGGTAIRRRPMSLERPKVLENPLSLSERGATNSVEVSLPRYFLPGETSRLSAVTIRILLGQQVESRCRRPARRLGALGCLASARGVLLGTIFEWGWPVSSAGVVEDLPGVQMRFASGAWLRECPCGRGVPWVPTSVSWDFVRLAVSARRHRRR